MAAPSSTHALNVRPSASNRATVGASEFGQGLNETDLQDLGRYTVEIRSAMSPVLRFRSPWAEGIA